MVKNQLKTETQQFLNSFHPVIWLFCRVIDNFGDAGVAWRMARLLQQEGWRVYLWMDNLLTLTQLVPQVNAHVIMQQVDDVTIYSWQNLSLGSLKEATLPHVVVELFGCDLPEIVKQKIAKRQALWLNWEYLSAEDWALEYHQMPSLQPNGLEKYFYFMGFHPDSGGLLREAQPLIAQGLAGSGCLRLFVFTYPTDVWCDWLTSWSNIQSVHWDVVFSTATPEQPVTAWTERIPANTVALSRQAFMSQQQFDDFLLGFDIVMIRGEDSFVRAQYAGCPFFWHIYPQQDDAHWVKLDAFWQQVYLFFPKALAHAHAQLSDELNGKIHLDAITREKHWRLLVDNYGAWRSAMLCWRRHLLIQPSATEKLANWLIKRLK